MKKDKFDIQGMTCSSCSSHIEKAVSKLNGVRNVSVNLLSNNMVVEYDENTVNQNEIIKSVVNSGYEANLSNNKIESLNKEENNINGMKKRLLISFCFLIPLVYLTMGKMIGFPMPYFFEGNENSIIYCLTQFFLLLPIIFVNRNFFIIGFKRLIKLKPNMDSLIAIGSGAAIVYGVLAIYMISYGLGHGKVYLVENYLSQMYFESAGMILTLVTLGKYFESKSKGKTNEAITKLVSLVPKTAIIIKNDKEVKINIDDILVGDILIVKPGATIPVDGNVIEGESSIDESSITGESMPVYKTVGDSVISGTNNKNGYLKIQATKVGKDTTISQIIKLVEEASNSKAPISKLADKISGVFVPIVIAIALLSGGFWLINGQTLEFALNISISVLVISCPCALGLATPVAIMVGTGKGAQNGILIKNAESMETLYLVDTVVLDKTGTITEGKPEVTDIISYIDKSEFIKIAVSLEKKSEHMLSEAILSLGEGNYEVNDFISIPGRGIKGKITNEYYFAGNIELMKENNIDIAEKEKKLKNLSEEGKTIIYFANSNKCIGIIAIQDTIKETSYRAINELKKNNIEVIMLTGDNKITAERIAKTLSIDKNISNLLPKDKEMEIEKLQKKGKKVAFVGDGINDSPAITKANVGFAIGAGTDIAIESADIVLIKNNLEDVVVAIDLSKKIINNIKTNLFWAFFYNAIGIPIAAGLIYENTGIILNPMIAATAMSLSSICVVTNALRLQKFKNRFIIQENRKMKTIYIEGMQCDHCKMSVENALNSLDGIRVIEVNLKEKKAIIECENQDENSKIIETIEKLGFKIKKID